MPGVIPSIAVITPGMATKGEALLERAMALYEIGLRMLVVREPKLAAEDQARLHEGLLDRCPELWVVHHLKCPGTQALQDAVSISVHCSSAHLREGMGSRFGRFGASIHNEQELAWALEQGASYVFLAPIWSPNSKPNDTRKPLGPKGLEAMQAGCEIPIFALGGVNPQRCAGWAGRVHGNVALIGRLFSGEWDQAKGDYLALARLFAA